MESLRKCLLIALVLCLIVYVAEASDGCATDRHPDLPGMNAYK
jgi:hypothetical protein